MPRGRVGAQGRNPLYREIAASLQLAGDSGPRRPVQPRPVLSRSSVLVFDVDAAGIDRAAAHARGCDVRLVALTSEEERAHLRDGLSAVLLLRALTSSRLLSCVRALKEGNGSVPPEVLCQMIGGRAAPSADEPDPELTDRELDVLRLLADGDSTRDIANRLSYSERTVKNVVRDVLAKLKCRTRAHAAALAARRRLI
jgi:DNA-binding NarL/FixJ family response regulator